MFYHNKYMTQHPPEHMRAVEGSVGSWRSRGPTLKAHLPSARQSSQPRSESFEGDENLSGKGEESHNTLLSDIIYIENQKRSFWRLDRVHSNKEKPQVSRRWRLSPRPPWGLVPTECGWQGVRLHLLGFLPHTDILFLPRLSSGTVTSNHGSLGWRTSASVCWESCPPAARRKAARGLTFPSALRDDNAGDIKKDGAPQRSPLEMEMIIRRTVVQEQSQRKRKHHSNSRGLKAVHCCNS